MNHETHQPMDFDPLSLHERQFEDLRSSPDDFDPAIEMPVNEFLRYFRLVAREQVDMYKHEGLRASRYLREEAIYPDDEISRIYGLLCGRAEKEVLTWGDFADFRLEYMVHWNRQHGHERATTSKLPDASELSA